VLGLTDHSPGVNLLKSLISNLRSQTAVQTTSAIATAENGPVIADGPASRL